MSNTLPACITVLFLGVIFMQPKNRPSTFCLRIVLNMLGMKFAVLLLIVSCAFYLIRYTDAPF